MDFGPGCPWYEMLQQYGEANVKWCEQRICALVNEPANAWSNLAFIIPAIFMMIEAAKHKAKTYWFFGISVFTMGFFSFTYHATNNFFTQIFDFIGMYIFVYLMVCLNFYRLGLSFKKAIGIYFLLIIVSTAVIPYMKDLGIPYQAIIPFGSMIVILTELIAYKSKKSAHEYKYFFGCIICFIVAAVFSLLDLKRIMCDPHNHFLQGHAMWHIVGGLGTISAFLFYRQFHFIFKH